MDTQGALASLDKAITLDPAFVQAYYNRALIRNSLGNLDKACADLDAATKQQPQNPEFTYTKAVLLYQAKKTDEARKIATELLKQFPTYAPARQLLQQLNGQ